MKEATGIVPVSRRGGGVTQELLISCFISAKHSESLHVETGGQAG